MRLIGIQKTRFILDNFFEQSFKGKEPDRGLFDKLTSAAELHYLASIYNWDDGTEVLEWIIDHPRCDKATALLIFWRAEPDFYTRFTNEAEADYEADTFRLVRQIVSHFANAKYKKASLNFVPTAEGHDVNYIDPEAKWAIPENLKVAVRGSTVYSVLDILNRLQAWWKALERQQKRRRRKKK